MVSASNNNLYSAVLSKLLATSIGHQGALVKCIGSCEEGQIWQRRLHNGDLAVAFFNLNSSTTGKLCVTWNELELEENTQHKVSSPLGSC